MSPKIQDNNRAELKQLWGRNVPPLTPDEIDLSIKVWQKIKARKQQEQNSQLPNRLS